jgi:hypothetical protein
MVPKSCTTLSKVITGPPVDVFALDVVVGAAVVVELVTFFAALS